VRLITVGHGTLEPEVFAGLLVAAGVTSLVDVRSAPGSRRHPAFGRAPLEGWLPAAGVSYRWEARLGGLRRAGADSPNTALRHPSFQGYADHMRTAQFADALDGVIEEGRTRARRDGGAVCVLCAESVWWRCHRRLLADAVVLTRGVEVRHLMHDGRLAAHRATAVVRVDDEGLLVYDVGAMTLPGFQW